MKAQGFTLIEVLVAMMIIAIAFTAILKVTGDNIEQVDYLETRVEAHWVAVEIINSVNADIINPSTSGELLTGTVNAFKQEWQWKIHLAPTLNKQIFEINTQVLLNNKPIENLVGIKSLDPARLHDTTL